MLVEFFQGESNLTDATKINLTIKITYGFNSVFYII